MLGLQNFNYYIFEWAAIFDYNLKTGEIFEQLANWLF